MSDTILSNRWVVYYEADNRQKRIERDTSVTPTVTDTVNGLYSALQDLFDELTQLDDGTPMSAQTPTEYTIGIIDTGDDDPWFIDNTSVEYLTGGAIQTASWLRAEGTNTGIQTFDYTVGGGTDFAQSDKGLTISSAANGCSGTLLHFITDGSNGTVWVRPDTSAAANTWDNTPAVTDMVAASGTGTGLTQDSAAISGEDLWANINTIGTVASNTHVYIEQNGALLTASEATTDWWADGQIDILIKVKEAGTEIDEGVIGVFARQLTKTYSYFSSDLTNGGRTAIPLGTGTDLNNGEGVRQMVLTTGATAEPLVGDVISDDTSPTEIQGVITSVSGTNPNVTLQYYLIGDPLTDFTTGANAFTASPSGFTSTNVASQTDVNSGIIAGLSIAHNDVGSLPNQPFDVDEDETNETYSIEIDVSGETLTDAYQWTQWLTRRGGTTTGNTDGQEGQFYLGIDTVLVYSGSVTGTVTTGEPVSQETSGATGIIVGHDTTNKIITLRSSRGTWATNATTETLTETTNGGTIEIDVSATAVAPNTAAPYGTFAGGKWFLARGVVLSNVLAADAQNFQTTTDDGTTVVPPNKQALTIANTRALDHIAVFELTAPSGIIDKGQYVSAVGTIGDTTLGVTTGTKTAITADTPGKTTGGVMRIVDDSTDIEYRLRYASWTGTTFTLANNDSGTTDDTGGTTSSTNLHDNGQNFLTTVLVGDLVRATGPGGTGISYVTAVVDDDNLTISPAIPGLVSGDGYALNVLPITTTTSDSVYVPLMDVHETAGTDASTGNESVTITYGSDIPVLIITRNSTGPTETTIPMLPYSAEATFESTGLSNNVIRTLDSIKN
jgi:hypothetical protein